MRIKGEPNVRKAYIWYDEFLKLIEEAQGKKEWDEPFKKKVAEFLALNHDVTHELLLYTINGTFPESLIVKYLGIKDKGGIV
ncbi:MAG: hypothetical protein V1701_02730 [Planctomycetota bacterium]